MAYPCVLKNLMPSRRSLWLGLGLLLMVPFFEASATQNNASCEKKWTGELRVYVAFPKQRSATLPRAATRLPSPGSLRVEIETFSRQQAEKLARQWEREKVEVEIVAGRMIQAVVSMDDLCRISESAWVRKVGFVTFPQKDHVTSEGLEMMGVPFAQHEGVFGAGVHVLVIDEEFQGYRDLLGTELPADTATYSTNSGGFEATRDTHGISCAEIVHDIAPEAKITLGHADTTTEYLAMFEWATQNPDIDVVSMSIGWVDIYPLDGTSEISQSFQALADAGKIVVKSAGNRADELIALPLSDTNANGIADLWEEDGRLPLWVGEDRELDITLRWSDAFGASDLDLDLCIYDENLELEFCGGDIQDGDDDPVERIWMENVEYGRHWAEVRCDPNRGCPLDVEIRLSSPDWTEWLLADQGVFFSRERSISVPADAKNIIAVGAVGYYKYYRSVTRYSSEGPTDDDRTKPDIFGPSHVSTSVTMYPEDSDGFSGTSAATPHVAGMAALLLSDDPTLDRDEILQRLKENADRDIDGNLLGSGLAYYDSSSIDCEKECRGRCGSIYGCECFSCPSGSTCDERGRCIAKGAEGDPCKLDDFVNEQAGDCRDGLVCLGKYTPQGPCDYRSDCTATSWWRNFDCVEKQCYRSYCFIDCADISCPSGYEREETSGGTCYCSPDTWACVPDCENRVCGDDGCGGSCGPACAENKYCTRMGQCSCLEACGLRHCGPNPFCSDESCGTCAEHYECVDGTCECQPNCGSLECGMDPICGTLSCGTCGDHEDCRNGACVCQPECGSTECGMDPICGTQSCGSCGENETCASGICTCQPDCSALNCGPDPVCGTSCGTCEGDSECREGACVSAKKGGGGCRFGGTANLWPYLLFLFGFRGLRRRRTCSLGK